MKRCLIFFGWWLISLLAYAVNSTDPLAELIKQYRQGNYLLAANQLTQINSKQSALAMYYASIMHEYGYGLLRNTQLSMQELTTAASAGLGIAQRHLANYYLYHQQYAQALLWNKRLAAQGDQDARSYCAAARKYGIEFAKNNIANYGFFDASTTWHNALALRDNHYNPYPQLVPVSLTDIYQPTLHLAQPTSIPLFEFMNYLMPLLANNLHTREFALPVYPIDPAMQALENTQSPILQQQSWSSIRDDGLHIPSQDDTEDQAIDWLTWFVPTWQLKINYQQVLTYLYQRAILGDADAQFKIGQLYHYGIAVSKNIDQAKTYYGLATLQQDVRAEYNLGILYLTRQTQFINYEKAVEWLTDAAFKGNAYAQYVLGMIYTQGLQDQEGFSVIAPDKQKATAMLYLAAANHFSEAQYRLAGMLPAHQQKLIQKLYMGAYQAGIAEAELPMIFYGLETADASKQIEYYQSIRQQAEAGQPVAMILLGLLLDRGLGTAQNIQEALQWYEKVPNNPIYDFILGTYYIEGDKVPKDLNQARLLLQRSAQAGFAYAYYNLAVLQAGQHESYINNLHQAIALGNAKAAYAQADYAVIVDTTAAQLAEAKAIYAQKVRDGDPDAQLKLAYFYDKGLDGILNHNVAQELYAKSARQGRDIAAYLLGMMYQIGLKNVYPNYQESVKWYKQAQHYSPALVALGFIYETIYADYTHARQAYEQVLQQENTGLAVAIAEYNLGLIYELGKGVAVDLKQAEAYYLQAVQHDSTHIESSGAMTRLGFLYFNGLYGQSDATQAVAWFKQAAKLANPDANYQLGLFSEAGYGVFLDRKAAIHYYKAAAQMGHEKAKIALSRMSSLSYIAAFAP